MKISEIVLKVRNTAGWLTIVERVYGKIIANLCESYDDDLIAVEKLCEKFYFGTEHQKVRKDLDEWKKEMKDFSDECKNRRHSELEKILENAKLKLSDILQHRGQTEKKKELLENIKKLERILENNITPEKIEQAKNYPLEKLIDVKGCLARCINHDDTNPSMNCKNNFVYCHSCGFTADTIGVYQKLKNCGFAEAVNFLSS